MAVLRGDIEEACDTEQTIELNKEQKASISNKAFRS
jgi:hypothetical protein